jgi:hypothetical protein
MDFKVISKSLNRLLLKDVGKWGARSSIKARVRQKEKIDYWVINGG